MKYSSDSLGSSVDPAKTTLDEDGVVVSALVYINVKIILNLFGGDCSLIVFSNSYFSS